MKSSHERKLKSTVAQVPRIEDRPLRAWMRCQRVLSLFDQHAKYGARNLATNMLENAAAHLELLADHPFFRPGADMLNAFQQDAANKVAGETLASLKPKAAKSAKKLKTASVSATAEPAKEFTAPGVGETAEEIESQKKPPSKRFLSQLEECPDLNTVKTVKDSLLRHYNQIIVAADLLYENGLDGSVESQAFLSDKAEEFLQNAGNLA